MAHPKAITDAVLMIRRVLDWHTAVIERGGHAGMEPQYAAGWLAGLREALGYVEHVGDIYEFNASERIAARVNRRPPKLMRVGNGT